MVLLQPNTSSPHGSPTPLLCLRPSDAESSEEITDIASNPIHHLSPLPLTLSFTNLTYTIKEPKTKVLLNDISGEAHNGEILAVLGPSGSGKSTLIDALAYRKKKGSLKGIINLNGKRLDSNLHKVISSYVMQNDLLFPMLTIEETLTFAAELKLPPNLSKSEKQKRVQDLIDKLDLRNAFQTMIGDESHRGISGGERRRVSIGIEIIQDPILLFLDEPITGLDSTSAFTVVKVIQRISKTGSIVIMSIHQPSFRVLGLLNQLMFLSNGEIVYNGYAGNLSSYLSDFGYSVPVDQNPSEAALDLICDLNQTIPNGIKAMVEFNRTWQRQNIVKRAVSEKAIISSIPRKKLVFGAFANPFWMEILVLLKRSFLNSSRLPELLITRFGITLLTATIFASLCWQLDISPQGNTERIRFLGFAVTTVFYLSAEGWGSSLQERNIIMRETSTNSYRKSSYLISHGFSWIPSLLLLSIAFSTITFCGVGLDGGFKGFLFYFGIIFGSFWTGNSFVTLMIELVPQVFLGFTTIVASLSCFLFFCGLYISRDRIPSYWIWFHYLSIKKYPYQALMQNQYGDVLQSKCFVRAIQAFDNNNLVVDLARGELKEEILKSISLTLGKNLTGSTCITTGADILKDRGITDLSKWQSFWITIGWGFFFRLLCYLALLRGNNYRRK
ncbi:hypothetical protein M9H77_33742 [Catharanthus roseus]|uniref:Uncharacterized protein n=1 Tax=Catharanthus roseus TaxID=4058 RepID=A0ACB9ZJB5_CATRO|nr:hypothetical protein M9H77_33742 [Catharanthus roseus]